MNYMWMIAFIMIIIFVTLTQLMKKSDQNDKESSTQFECGFNLMNPSHVPFSFQFFLISLLFLIFDVEIALIISFPLEPQNTKSILMIVMFILILTAGLIYEWQKSKISWSS